MAQEHQREAQRAAGLREPKMHVTYVLSLGADEDGNSKYYIGSSQNFLNRMHNHIMGNDRSAMWVRRWKFEELVETRHCHDRLSALTTAVGLCAVYKARYGWRNVRGAQDWPPEEGLERARARSRSPPRPDDGD